MTYDEIRTAWNAQADDGNRWHSLSEGEKIEWAAIHAAAKARGPAPIFNSAGWRKLESLQRKGFRVVGYAMEHCNSWQDNRRCTVDYNGLVSWVPSADEEVAKERASRQAAQVEVAELKGRLARAGFDRCRAVLEEREACAKVCDALVDKKEAARIRALANEALQSGDEEDQLQAMRHELTVSTFNAGIKSCAAAIRARK